MEIVYAAHTESGVFMLDAQGVCRWAVSLPGRTREKVPERIVGAQYLATLDLESTGGLVDLPRVGCPMLFAATDETGRIRLLRTPPVLRFEDRRTTIKGGPAPIRDFEKTPAAPASVPGVPVATASTTPTAPVAVPSPPSESLPPPSARPLPLVRPPQQSFAGALPPPPLPPPPAMPRMTPLPPPPRARIAARLPPPPPFPPAPSAPATTRMRDRQSSIPPERGHSPSGIRPAPNAPVPISVPVRVRAANMSIKRLVRGK